MVTWKRDLLFVVATEIAFLLLGTLAVKGDEGNGIHADPEENRDLVITYKQKLTLDEFKKRVLDRLPHDYMKEDVFLLRWLRATGFDIKNADLLLTKNLKWRKEFKIDGILDEDFSDVNYDHPVQIDTFTKSGRPVITGIAGQWDMRQGFLTGRDKRAVRYIYQVTEKAATMVREAQQAGKNVTRFDLILSLDGFNLAQHYCPRCVLGIRFYLRSDFIRLGANYYPEITDRITVINTPAYIRGFFEPIIRAVLTQTDIDSVRFKLLGTDINEWRRYFLQYIDENQLPEEFGGLRVRN